MHIHTTFDELFMGGDQPVKMIVGEEIVTLNPGETILVAKGIPHKMFNDTNFPVTLNLEDSGIPEQFAVYLNQVYGYMDESPNNMKMPKVIFQMSLFSQHFDSYLGEGPPVIIQKALYFFVRPMARLMGFQSYYKEYSIKR